MARRGARDRIATMHVVLRTTAPFDETAPFIRDVVREIDPTLPIVRLREMDDVLQESIRRPRLLSHTVSIFAGLALLIAVIGTYGLLSYTVTNRRREIGIRMALGASRAAILAQILRWGLALVLIGTVAGVAAAIGLSQFITSLLFGIAATDATTLSGGRRRRHGRGHGGLLDSRVARLTFGPAASHSRGLAGPVTWRPDRPRGARLLRATDERTAGCRPRAARALPRLRSVRRAASPSSVGR